jgi:CRP/FNR family transcriptional regulator, cyclic AMP receptor protein
MSTEKKKSSNLTLKKGDILIREGQESTSMFYVQSGSFLVTRRKANGETINIGQIHSGELVGEMSFLDKEPRCATVTAASEVELVEIPAEKFKDILAKQPVWLNALVLTLTKRLRKANALIKV